MSAEKDPSRSTSSGSEYVQLREFEQRIQELKDLIASEVKHERELREAKQASIGTANTLALNEIDRRLGELNHAHAQAMENWARTLPREMFESWQKEYDRWKLDINTTLTATAPLGGDVKALEARISAQAGLSAAFSTAMTDLSELSKKVEAIEKNANRISGGIIFAAAVGILGLISVIVGFARIAGLIGVAR